MAAAGAKGDNKLKCFLYSRCLGVSFSLLPQKRLSCVSIDPRAWASWRRAPVFIRRSQTLWRHEEVDHTIEPIRGGGAYCNQECFGRWQSTNVLLKMLVTGEPCSVSTSYLSYYLVTLCVRIIKLVGLTLKSIFVFLYQSPVMSSSLFSFEKYCISKVWAWSLFFFIYHNLVMPSYFLSL